MVSAYKPLKIVGNSTGLVQERENFLLPDDAYPILQNAYIFRERILRKQGYQFLGRLQRSKTISSLNTDNLITGLSLESTSSITPGTISITDNGGNVYTEPTIKDGTLVGTGGQTGTINYSTGAYTITGALPITGSFQYYPGLPVMGIRTEEVGNSAFNQTIFFDQKYAYIFNNTTNAFEEFIPGTTWNAHNGNVEATDFFWSTNYWVGNPSDAPGFTQGNKLFWVTNNTGQFHGNADPIKITDGVKWVAFAPPTYGQIDATNFVTNCLAFLPFRGRLIMFNTWEGTSSATAQNYFNRIRWSQIGNPFTPYAAGPPSTGAWRDDIQGRGGYLDIPTSEDIVSIGFVRDNLVVYCERSTWQLRYTGRSIAPFSIERVNSENGVGSTFSSIQFDTSLVGIGDKGIIECDSYQAKRIDDKILDFVFQINNSNNGPQRVHGIRDFPNKLAYWTFPTAAANGVYPDIRLIYNYENASWATFTDSLTCLGNYQSTSSTTWTNTDLTWLEADFTWINQPSETPLIVGGNQQGFVEMMDQTTVNDPSLYISAITANNTTATVITSPNHNMKTGFVIRITEILPGTDYVDLNGGIYGIVLSASDPTNKFEIFTYNTTTQQFSDPVLHVSGIYSGGGIINIRENFSVVSKKFNFLDEGQNIQLGYIDILMQATQITSAGAISLKVYLDYNDNQASNILPLNNLANSGGPNAPDTVFNATIPTTSAIYDPVIEGVGGTKFWQRVYCATRASFITLQYTFSNAQMASLPQTQQVQIDAQVLWMRRAGRLTQG